MKKSMISLTLLLSLLASTGCSQSAKAKEDKDGNDVMYTYKDTDVTANDVYADLLDSTAGSKAIFDTVYKKVIQSTMELDENKARNTEIQKEVDEEMVTWLQDAKNQASDNGVSRDTMIDALLEEEGVESTDELEEKKIYAKQKEYAEEIYFDNNRDELVKEYVKEYRPVHVKGILVKVADTNYTHFARSISEDETKKLARTLEELMKGREFNVLASNTYYSDHSSAQIEAGGDLGIMDATTSFNNEYKLGIYSYFAYKNSTKTNIVRDTVADDLLGNEVDKSDNTKKLFDEFYGKGFNVITKDQVANLKGSAELKKYYNGELINSNTRDGEYKSLNLPRNVIYNNFFNGHKVSFLAADDNITNKTTVTCANTTDGNATVVANRYGYPILVLTDENGVQFISIEMDSFGTHEDDAVTYFGSTTSTDGKIEVDLNDDNTNEKMTPFYELGGKSNRNARKEIVDNQIKNYINKGFSNSISANQDFYYYRIYNEWVTDATNGAARKAELFGEGYETSKYYTSVTNYITAVEDYRDFLIKDSKSETGKNFAKTLRLEKSYEDWIRPEWLAYYKTNSYTYKFVTDTYKNYQEADVLKLLNDDPNDNGTEKDYLFYEKNLGTGGLY